MTSAERLLRRSRPAALLAVLLAIAACARDEGPLALAGPVMGTRYEVLVADPVADANALHRAVDAELQRVNDLMSTYLVDSELSRFNASAGGDWFPVSQDTARVVAAALELGRLTAGALDVTVGPLVNLWGFGPGGQALQRPDDEALGAARARVGQHLLEVRRDPPALRKQRDDLSVDLSAIAKGYAVDRVAELLAARGLVNYLVDVGGELRAAGEKRPDLPWRVAVERPRFQDRSVQRVLTPGDNALATSGDYRNFFVAGGRRYSHIIDPRSGEPVRQSLASASVLAPSAMRADGLATALLVMGAEAALAFAEDQRLAVLLIERRDGAFVERTSSSMAAYLPPGAAP